MTGTEESGGALTPADPEQKIEWPTKTFTIIQAFSVVDLSDEFITRPQGFLNTQEFGYFCTEPIFN